MQVFSRDSTAKQHLADPTKPLDIQKLAEGCVLSQSMVPSSCLMAKQRSKFQQKGRNASDCPAGTWGGPFWPKTVFLFVHAISTTLNLDDKEAGSFFAASKFSEETYCSMRQGVIS